MKEANRLEGIHEYYFSKKLREVVEMNKQGADVLNLGIGNPDLMPPEEAMNELGRSSLLAHSHGYQSYKGIDEFRGAIADWSNGIYGIELNPSTEILPMIGSKEGIMHVSQAFVNAGDEVLVPNPGYPTYRSVSEIVGAKTIEYSIVPETGIDMEEIISLVSDRTKILWLNFPHMPTGIAANRSTLRKLIELAKEKNFLIVNDNPYSTILAEEYFSIFQLEGAKEVCLELNSLSKSHNMAGWRVGWLAGKELLINSVLKVKSNMDSGMFRPIQEASIKALKVQEDWIQELNLEYKKRRLVAWKILDELTCEYDQSAVGLFIWARIPDHYSEVEELTEDLLHKAYVFITPGFIFGSNGNRYIRISLCTSEGKLESALKRILKLKTN